MLNCIDNSGAAIVECVAVMKKKTQPAKIGTICSPGPIQSSCSSDNDLLGDRIIVVVQKQRSFGPDNPGGTSLGISNKVRRGDIRHAVVVRARKEEQRKDGTLIKFGDNACVLIQKNGDPIGTRLSSIVGAELRDKKWSKILSLAPMHI